MRIHIRACRCRRRDRHQSKQLLAPSDAVLDATNPGSSDAIAMSVGSVYNLLGRNPPVSDTASEHSHFPDHDVPGCFNFARCPQSF